LQTPLLNRKFSKQSKGRKEHKWTLILRLTMKVQSKPLSGLKTLYKKPKENAEIALLGAERIAQGTRIQTDA